MGLAKNEGNNIIKDHIIIMVPFPKVGNRAGSVSSVHCSYTVRGNCPHTKPATWTTRGCPDVKPFTLDQASMVGPSRGKTSTSSSPRKVTLHRMICMQRQSLSQHSVATLEPFKTMLQHCVALKVVVANRLV